MYVGFILPHMLWIYSHIITLAALTALLYDGHRFTQTGWCIEAMPKSLLFLPRFRPASTGGKDPH